LVPIWATARSGASANVRNIVILDASGVGLGRRVADVLSADSSIRTRGAPAPDPVVRVVSKADVSAAEDSATHEVMRPGSFVGYLVLDDSVLAGTRINYAGRNASSIAEIDKIRSAVRQAVTMDRLQREGVKPETINQISKMTLRMPAVRIDERGRSGSGTAGVFLGIGIGILLMMSITFH